MDSGRLVFSSAAPCRAAGVGGGQMLLFGSSGGFLGGSPVVAGVEDGRRKRPFLTTLDEELQLDGEMYGYGLDEHAPERKRRLTAEQVRALERSFEEEKRKLEPERKSELARRLGMAPRQVAVWFQNRRARWKGKQLEQDFDALRAAHDELLAGRDALLADNDRLRSQVTSLTEKLQARPSPAPEPEEEQTAASATVHAAAAAATRAVQLNEGSGYACAETNAGGGAAAAALDLSFCGGDNNDSPESYLAGARSPPSSSDDDCGGEVDYAFFLPDAVLDVGAVERESAQREVEEEEAQLNYWAWFWN